MRTHRPILALSSKLFTPSFFIVVLLVAPECYGSRRDLSPSLQNAITIVGRQKRATERAAKNIKKDGTATAFPNPSAGYRDLVNGLSGVFSAMTLSKDQLADGTPIETGIRNNVKLNRSWLVQAQSDLDENAVTSAWLLILQSSKTLAERDRKRLFKAVAKVMLTPWNEL